MTSISLENDGFYIIDDKGNKRLFNDSTNDPMDQLSAALTVRTMVKKYVPEFATGNQPILLDNGLWASVVNYKYVGGDLSGDFNNRVNDLKNNGWTVVNQQSRFALLKSPNFQNDHLLKFIMLSVGDWPGYSSMVEVNVSPTHREGYHLSSYFKTRGNYGGDQRHLTFDVDSSGVTFRLDSSNDCTVEWSEFGLDPIIVGREDFTKDLTASITVSNNEVSVLVDNQDLSQADVSTKAEFVSLLYSLDTKDKGWLCFPGLAIQDDYHDDFQEPILSGDRYQVGWKDVGVITKSKGDGDPKVLFGPPDMAGSTKSSITFVTEWWGGTANVNLVDMSHDFHLTYGYCWGGGELIIPWQRFAVKGVCLAGV